MSSGGYDGLHPSASYGHGDSWKPSGSSSSWVDRDAYYDRRPESPGRRYSSYEGYYAQEDSYKSNSYRPEDDDPYYSRSPSPDHYSRYTRPLDTWESSEPWGSVPAPWEDTVMVSISPASKARRDPMIATRMFEPSDSWKQTHVDHPSRTDRHIGEPLQPRTPNSYYPNTFSGHPSGDSYRSSSYRETHTRGHSYRPGPNWPERIDGKNSAPVPVANGKDIKYDVKPVVKSTDVEMAPPVPTTIPAVTNPNITHPVGPSVKTMGEQSSDEPLSRKVEAKTVQPLSAPGQQATVQPISSSLLDNDFSMPQTQSKVNASVKVTVPATELPTTAVKSKGRDDRSNTDGDQRSMLSSPIAPIVLLVSNASSTPIPTLTDSSQHVPVVVVESRRTDTNIVSLPTPLPTPRPLLDSPALQESLPTEAKSLRDALRVVVMTRLLCDRQTREERIEPVLKTNQAQVALFRQEQPSSTPENLIKEILEGPRHEERLEQFQQIKGSLVERFKERQNALTQKVQRLKQEYFSLHERWLAHCAVLDDQNKPAAPEPEIVQPAGRTTRRSTAILGDAVRSDLEMEQIIASLGNDDATDPNHLSLRNLATIPDMISVTRGGIDCIYDDTNHLVENPHEYYRPHTGIDDWTESEKEIFLDKFAAHPKQFGMIAEHLPNKTAAQCVDYYYLHKKKLIDFRKVISQYAPNKRKRGRTGKKKGNGLLADIRQHDAEVHGENGSPRSTGRLSRGRKPMPPPEPKEPKKAPTSRRRNQLELTPSASATPTPEPETRRRGGRRSAGAPLSRTVSVSLDDAEEEPTEEVSERPAKRAKRGGRRVIKSAATVVDEPPTSDAKAVELSESVSRRKPGTSLAQWSDEDKSLFLTLLAQHGDDFKRIAASMPNKTTVQVSNYYKTNCDELGLEAVAASAPKRSPTPDAMQEVPTPSTAATPAAESHDQPIVSLAPDSLHMNGAPARLSAYDSDSTTPATWPHSGSRQPTPPSHVRSYYPMNSRPTPYYPPHPTYAPPIPCAYPHYPHFPPYDPSQVPYTVPDPNHRMPMPIHSRDTPYPPGQPPYPYSQAS
ncbi:hypothetical protein C0991_010508 [Blastosporella zonata]|nr:hypothetical protein C0991_010508 [Blastosporella zonata]